MDVLDNLDQAAACVTEVARGIRADQLARPTPCADWNVQQLADHMIGSFNQFAARAEGREPESLDKASPSGFDDTMAQLAGSVQAAARAWRTPGALGLQMGPMSGQAMATITLGEMLIHGWDLATATSQPVAIDDETPASALAGMRGMLSPQMRGAAFGQDVPAPSGATALEQLVAFAGRTVDEH